MTNCNWPGSKSHIQAGRIGISGDENRTDVLAMRQPAVPSLPSLRGLEFSINAAPISYRWLPSGSWLSLTKNRQYVPTTVKDTDNLQRVALGVVHDDVIRKGLDRPKPKWKLGYLLADTTA